MSIKTLLYIMNVCQPKEDCDIAIDICRTLGVHLSVLIIKRAITPPIGDYGISAASVWVKQQDQDISELQGRVKELTARLAQTDILSDVDSAYDNLMLMSDRIRQRARFSDLTMIGPGRSKDDDLKVAILNGALFESARPLLLMPTQTAQRFPPKVVMLAWDGHLEAARAAREALPFLKLAQRVCVIEVDPLPGIDGHELVPGVSLATYLARHDVKVEINTLPSIGDSVGEVLLRHANDIGAEMVVMGAYTHSRLRERIFGGVTKSMIERAQLPLFMAH